ncbi:MAG TPA: hypothetical protein VK658_06815 [Chryseolinea sp.]|nr:hypothetical protein [Chryseolinea sp.]
MSRQDASAGNDVLWAFYRDRREHFSRDLTGIKAKINTISNLRIATAIVFLACLYGAFTFHGLFYALLPLIAAFIAFVLIHTRLFVRKVHLENLITINAAEGDSLRGDRTKLHTGAEFMDPHHPYTHDLDIFGEGSVYQLINRCNTHDGRQSLARLLSQPLQTAGIILEFQQAAKELATNVDLRQDLAASGLEINEQPDDRQQLLAWLKTESIAYGKPIISVLLWLLPVLTISAWILYFIEVIPQVIPYTLVLVQWIIWGRFSKQINVFHDYISRKKDILEKYAYMLAIIRKGGRHDKSHRSHSRPRHSDASHNDAARDDQFESTVLKELVSRALDAGSNVNLLVALVGQLNARLNFLTAVFVNSLFLYDLRCVYRLEKWKVDNGVRLPLWLDAISQAEVLSSVANFAYNHPHCQFPVIHEEWAIRAEDMGHPLLDPSGCVPNSVTIGPAPSVLIITGANMAGKSTFLRSLGVNLVLALAGSPVYAAGFRCPVIPLRSGMRTADSLKDHESYFYAELNRLKSIMDELREGKPLFILLDEILKGTNSTDKQKGSIALVQQLLEHPCLGVVATHDLAMGALSEQHPSSVHNYCFEASIENDQLFFDYKLKPGLAQNMNATFLMKKMGIIKENRSQDS